MSLADMTGTSGRYRVAWHECDDDEREMTGFRGFWDIVDHEANWSPASHPHVTIRGKTVDSIGVPVNATSDVPYFEKANEVWLGLTAAELGLEFRPEEGD